MKVWQFIQEKKAASIRVILLYVLESSGSSPGRQGFKMAVAEDGSFIGTIGGGIMEHKFVELARSRLAESAGDAALFRQVHDKQAGMNQSGMICSGEQTIFLYEVQPSDLEPIARLIRSLQANLNGTLRLHINGISFSDEIPDTGFHFNRSALQDSFILEEKTGYKHLLHIIGGGHCAMALSRIMHHMDFLIHVYDEREGLNTMNDNCYAHHKTIVPAYEKLHTFIQGGNNVYVVIMTFGYRTDDIALKALLGKTFRYIGMLGSKKKVEKMFEGYKAGNIDTSILERVHAPIGVPIKSQTADEIAVSIAAELIAEKNKDQ